MRAEAYVTTPHQYAMLFDRPIMIRVGVPRRDQGSVCQDGRRQIGYRITGATSSIHPFFIFVCLQHEFIDFLSDASQEEGGDLEHFHHIMQVEQTVLRLKMIIDE